MSSMPTGNPRIPEGINASEENPLKEFFLLLMGVGAILVAVVVMLSLAARILAPYIPFKWESALTPSVLALVKPESETAADNGPERALQALGQRLLDASNLVSKQSGEELAVPPASVFFHLMDEDFPNAFATLGGHIIVTDKLLDEIKTENGLAMVVAHEIAHIELRHPIEAASRGLVIQLVISAVLGGDMPGGILNGASTFTMLGFNREMELAADQWALTILRQHYGHLAGADEFFRSMDKNGGFEEWLEFAQTHPSTERRLKLIREAMAADSVAGVLTPLPVEFQAETGN